MITYHIARDHQQIVSVRVSGHAGYQKKGSDIVCAAVSTAILMTVNAMETLKLNHLVDSTVEEGDFTLDVKTSDEIQQGLLENLSFALSDLEKQYPKYIKNQKEG